MRREDGTGEGGRVKGSAGVEERPHGEVVASIGCCIGRPRKVRGV